MKDFVIATPLPDLPEVACVPLSVERAKQRVRAAYGLGDDLIAKAQAGVVTARNRLARAFLHQTECKYLLWWDSDVLPDDVEIVSNMIATGHDFVGAAYPRRGLNDGSYTCMFLPNEDGSPKTDRVGDCVEVAWMGFGFALTSRDCIGQMWASYKKDRWYVDIDDDWNAVDTVDLFGHQYSPIEMEDGHRFRIKLAEDYSFCQSWRDIGGKVQLYVGPSASIAHIGSLAIRNMHLPVKLG